MIICGKYCISCFGGPLGLLGFFAGRTLVIAKCRHGVEACRRVLAFRECNIRALPRLFMLGFNWTGYVRRNGKIRHILILGSIRQHFSHSLLRPAHIWYLGVYISMQLSTHVLPLSLPSHCTVLQSTHKPI